MKKLLFLVTALLAMVQQSSAQTTPVITVADVEAVPGETVAFSLNLTGGKVNLYTALQFDVQFPATGFSTTGASTVNSSWDVESKIVGDLDEYGIATVAFASSNAIPTAEVEDLVSVSFKVANTVGTGVYDVTLQNIFLGYNTSDKDYPANVTFKVKVVERHTVVLDELSTTAPTAATGVDVTVNRTIKANEWSTICLPFAMNAEQCQAAFGDDVELGDFNGIETTEEGSNITAITVNFVDATSIEANHPYIIKVKNAVTQFTVSNVNISPEDEPSVNKDEQKMKIGSTWYYFYNRFIGTYVADTAVPKNTLFLNDNKFWYSNGTTKMKAFRAYFNFLSVLTEVENASARMLLSFDGETTSIENSSLFQPKAAVDEWYTLDGRKLDKKPTAKGVYVKDGRKVVIK